MKVHAIVCSYFGPGEVDLGKTIPWLEWFTDTLFIYDTNLPPRPLNIDWAKTFPHAQIGVHQGKSYFQAPAGFRQAAFQAADRAWAYDPADYVVFIDGTEGISTNLAYDQMSMGGTGVPDNKFPYLYNDAAGGPVAFPVHVYLNQRPMVEFPIPADPDLARLLASELAIATDPAEIQRLNELQYANTAKAWECHPAYLDDPAAPTRYLTRMASVAWFRGTPNWAALDTYTSSPTAVVSGSCGIISYGYARFNEDHFADLDPTAPDSAMLAGDVGFTNRGYLNLVRSVPLPLTYTTPDPAGVQAVPTVPATVFSPPYAFLQHVFDLGDVGGPGVLDKFVSLIRRNPRDGVWYVDYVLGAAPIDPVTGNIDLNLPGKSQADLQQVWDTQIPSTTGLP